MKTIKEAAKEIFPNPDSNQITAFELGVEFAQRWIPVKEEFPVYDEDKHLSDKYDSYIVKYSAGGIYPKVFCKISHLVGVGRFDSEFDWTHAICWRPIELV